MRLSPACNSRRQKVKKAQQLWNTRDPGKIALAYTEGTHGASTQLVELTIAVGLSDSIWRNRDQFLKGRQEIIQFLTKKWYDLAFDSRVSVCSRSLATQREKERNYKLRKELFAFTDNKIAVQFWYEYQDAHDGMNWKRCCAWVTCIPTFRALINLPHISNLGIRRLRGLDFCAGRTDAQATNVRK